MGRFAVVWAASSALAFIAAWGARSCLRGRISRPWRMHLRGLAVLCLLAGGGAALLYDWLSARPVALPPELQRTPLLDAPSQRP
jgi:hypothetical protein